MQTDLIIINDYCERCHVDPSFIVELERYTHLYYDLSINVAGIDAIHHMLERIESLQHQVRSLKSELQFYR